MCRESDEPEIPLARCVRLHSVSVYPCEGVGTLAALTTPDIQSYMATKRNPPCHMSSSASSNAIAER